MTGPSPPVLSVVIPVYDEGAAIESVLRSLEESVATPHEVLVVYDFDEDDTLPPVRALLAELPAVSLRRNDLGPGALNAIRAGMAASRGRYVLVAMADGSDDHRVVDEMVSLADAGAVVVAASRYAPGGRQVGGPWGKALASRAAGLLLHHVGGMPIHDPTNNYKLYARELLDQVRIESTGGFEVALELSVKAYAMGLPMAEVPATWYGRTAGESRFDLRRWLPLYLRWWGMGMVAGLDPRRRARTRSKEPGNRSPERRAPTRGIW
ncbi:MAG: glycosyltransferase [Acidimicrobiales bacterium]